MNSERQAAEPIARRAALFVWKHLWNADTQTLLRRYRKGDAAVEGYAEDYAYLIFGLLELFQADGDARWLEWALMLQRRQDELFADPVEGGWFSTTGRDPSVLLRQKEELARLQGESLLPISDHASLESSPTAWRIHDHRRLLARHDPIGTGDAVGGDQGR